MSSSSLLNRASARYFSRHPWQFGLTLLGIALGVSVVTAVELASQSARRAFELSSEAVLGRTTHQIVGGTRGIPEQSYVELRTRLASVPAAPIIEAPVRSVDGSEVSLTLLGVDPLNEAEFRGFLSAAADERAAGRLLTDPLAAALSRSTAARLGLEPGDALALMVNGRRVELHVALLISPASELQRQGLENLVMTDLSTAQNVLGNAGYLSRIDLRIPRGQRGDLVLSQVRALIPAGARVVETGARTRATGQMTRAFELNLLMLGLLALVVGMFLIFNAMSFSVVQRRPLIGRLRVLGATRREVFLLVLGEAAVFGLIGAAAGILIGVVLAQELLALVTRTINDLYYSLEVSKVNLSAVILIKSLLLGVLGALVAALLPAFEAAGAPPRLALQRHELERRGRKLLPAVSAAGGACLAAALLFISWPQGNLNAAFAALFFMMFGFALLAPGAMVLTLRILRPVAAAGGDIASLALRGVGRRMSRTGVAVAALMVAVATTAGVAVMVDSFRNSVIDWLGLTLRADYYISVPGAGNLRSMAPETIRRVRETQGVAELSLGRRIFLESELGDLETLAIEMAEKSYDGFRIVSENQERAWRAFDERNGVLISEPVAWRSGKGAGDTLAFLTQEGFVPLEVAGVFRDYSTDRGMVLMSRATFVRYWKDAGITTIGVYAAADADPADLRRRLVRAASGDQALSINDAASIRRLSLEVFDRTFTITNVLRLLAVIIAFVGILSALMAIQLEAGREFAVLRALGLTRAQLFGIAEAQTGVLGLVAGVLALPLGVLLALMLVEVINRRSFGWSMSFEVDPALLVNALLLSLAASLLAGLYPAYRIADTSPAEVLREE